MVHISKLEMRGFKSFGHKKETIPLSSGLTAIVGPNGNGKSNVVDALSFVLGQRSSKTLRASSFADLIYHGSEGEKGKRAAPYARVKLTIVNDDNSLSIDSEKVNISRKVKRDGKSTYRLNGSRTTRQEIREVLSGKIIGKEGHNFVMQGDVDKFIKISPMERRNIIDDLAGIAEYEEKKAKSLSELEKVETNLQSQEGRIEELESKKKQLKEDRERYLKFQELQEELKKKEGTLTKMRVDSLEDKLNRIKSKMEEKDASIDELEEKIGEIEKKRNELREKRNQKQDTIEEMRESEDLKRVDKVSSRIETLEERLKSVKRDYESAKSETKRLQGKAKDLAEKTDESSPLEKIERSTERFEKLQKKFQERIDSAIQTENPEKIIKLIDEISNLLSELDAVISELSEEFKKALKSKKDFRALAEETEEIEKAGNEFDQLKSELTKAKARKEETENRLNDLKNRIKESKEELEEAERNAEEINGKIEDARSEIESLERRMKDLKAERGKMESQIQDLRDKRGDLNAERASARTELKQAKEDLRNYYDVETLDPSEVDREELKKDVKKLERRCNSMKPINETSLERYQEVKERYEDQMEHYNQLAEEKRTLTNLIEEIDEEKRDVFMDTFEEVSENFSEIFSELSPGGVGRLILENPERPLDGGLEIEAKPEGKKLENAASLSGGEKALTGLAFIFAIQRTKPTALYVLDEIDAHLDPENQKSVAKMVKKFSEESQIVVITFQDSMMSEADKLFGVNMDDQNISHIVSVDLNEYVEGGEK
ncbi:MAG: chromosome segregation SMC family protein [Candidatus Hadarchaeota archaeon]